ncbi:transcription factor bHLH96-like [Vigna umbellata]|uniref:transcription factor bHLH96-like n=1 Tax=Vigna umbellata TaxID=87088 RepID=UPI001F5F64DE|nr:transcription factor bHLH96-like [Vigna umbellata]
MALEAVVFPQDPFTYPCNKDYFYSLLHNNLQEAENKAFLGIITNNIDHTLHANWDSSSPSALQNIKDQWDSHSSPEPCTVDQSLPAAFPPPPPPSEPTPGRRKRRRTKSTKNKEEIENQRMTHIAVERNRRKQMNEYLAVLRSLMPPSYVQRGDQASIIGGAINFVKELEQLLQCMKGQQRTKENGGGFSDSSSPFAEFFMFPQYSTRATQNGRGYPSTCEARSHSWAVADIEVTLVDGHANIKILSKKQAGLLLKMVVGLQTLAFTILHLNVTTVDDMVLTSVSVKVEEGCQMNTVEEIAGAVHELSRRIQEEGVLR